MEVSIKEPLSLGVVSNGLERDVIGVRGKVRDACEVIGLYLRARCRFVEKDAGLILGVTGYLMILFPR